MQSESMDRGSEAMKSHLAGTDVMEIRQTRRGWLQECLGCDAKTVSSLVYLAWCQSLYCTDLSAYNKGMA